MANCNASHFSSADSHTGVSTGLFECTALSNVLLKKDAPTWLRELLKKSGRSSSKYIWLACRFRILAHTPSTVHRCNICETFAAHRPFPRSPKPLWGPPHSITLATGYNENSYELIYNSTLYFLLKTFTITSHWFRSSSTAFWGCCLIKKGHSQVRRLRRLIFLLHVLEARSHAILYKFQKPALRMPQNIGILFRKRGMELCRGFEIKRKCHGLLYDRNKCGTWQFTPWEPYLHDKKQKIQSRACVWLLAKTTGAISIYILD